MHRDSFGSLGFEVAGVRKWFPLFALWVKVVLLGFVNRQEVRQASRSCQSRYCERASGITIESRGSRET